MNISPGFAFISLTILAVSGITTQYPAASQARATTTLHIPGQGSIVGGYATTSWSEQAFMQFLGIPYAESPREELRFKVRKPNGAMHLNQFCYFANAIHFSWIPVC